MKFIAELREAERKSPLRGAPGLVEPAVSQVEADDILSLGQPGQQVIFQVQAAVGRLRTGGNSPVRRLPAGLLREAVPERSFSGREGIRRYCRPGSSAYFA